MADPQVALSITQDQLLVAILTLGAAIVALVLYIYQTEKSRVDARLSGLHQKVNEEVGKLHSDLDKQLTQQNLKLAEVIDAIENSTVELQKLYHELDKRLLANELRIGGAHSATSRAESNGRYAK